MKRLGSKAKMCLLVTVTLIALFGVVALAIATWTIGAATERPVAAAASIHLSPASGEPGTIVTVGGGGWEPGETILVYLADVEGGLTDGIVYGSAMAGSTGRMTTSFRYPQVGPWADRGSALVAVRGVSSGRDARAAFQVILPTDVPTVQPGALTAQPLTSAPALSTPAPAEATPTSMPPAPAPTVEPPAATPTATRPVPTAAPLPLAPTPIQIRVPGGIP